MARRSIVSTGRPLSLSFVTTALDNGWPGSLMNPRQREERTWLSRLQKSEYKQRVLTGAPGCTRKKRGQPAGSIVMIGASIVMRAHEPLYERLPAISRHDHVLSGTGLEGHRTALIERTQPDPVLDIAGSQDELPVLASVMFESVPQSTPAPHTSTQPETCPDTVARRTRNATRRSGSTTAMLPPPVPATPALAPPPAAALAPKPRGRQRLTEEEKAKRAAEKKRVMEEKKAEKAALKAAKDAEKAAAKAAKDAEKARKQGEKKKAGGPTKAEAATAAPHNEVISTSVPLKLEACLTQQRDYQPRSQMQRQPTSNALHRHAAPS
ncbi:predicted protein [Postia placenta Mad-698-R]|nr:predicted protein [Postia placenta Mad-698-R]